MWCVLPVAIREVVEATPMLPLEFISAEANKLTPFKSFVLTTDEDSS